MLGLPIPEHVDKSLQLVSTLSDPLDRQDSPIGTPVDITCIFPLRAVVVMLLIRGMLGDFVVDCDIMVYVRHHKIVKVDCRLFAFDLDRRELPDLGDDKGCDTFSGVTYADIDTMAPVKGSPRLG